MVCVYCGQQTRVINSRLQKKNNQTWRRRQCNSCNSIFTTLESADFISSLVYKNATSHLEPFQRDILFISIYEACRHRKTATSDATALTLTVLSKMRLAITNAQIDRTILLKIVTDVLSHFDQSAYVQYNAYHPINKT